MPNFFQLVYKQLQNKDHTLIHTETILVIHWLNKYMNKTLAKFANNDAPLFSKFFKFF